MSALMTWWRARQLREQRLLLLLAAIALPLAAWLLLVKPLADGLDEAKARHDRAVVALATDRALIAALAVDRPQAPAGPVDGLVAGTATQAGFPVESVRADGAEAATIRIDAARPEALFAWIASLEARGLIVDRLVLTANSDPTLAAEIRFLAVRP